MTTVTNEHANMVEVARGKIQKEYGRFLSDVRETSIGWCITNAYKISMMSTLHDTLCYQWLDDECPNLVSFILDTPYPLQTLFNEWLEFSTVEDNELSEFLSDSRYEEAE